jgi:hypothetical protein
MVQEMEKKLAVTNGSLHERVTKLARKEMAQKSGAKLAMSVMNTSL